VVLQILIAAFVAIAHIVAITLLVAWERRQPAATLAWLLTLIFVPVVGLLAWLLIGQTRYRRTVRRSERAAKRLAQVREQYGVETRLEGHTHPSLEPRTEGLLRLGAALASSPSSRGNRARILVDGAATYRAMLQAIDRAQHHVHVQFYIVQPDETGRQLRDHLVARAREGLEVRVLCDAVGSAYLPGRFWDPLLEAGGQAAWFRPVLRTLARVRRRHRIDFRNHRKILVLDGRVGFTGGINIGREYLGLDPSVGHWRDTHVEIEGPAVLSLQSTFAEDWWSATEQLIDEERYYPEFHSTAGDAIVQVIDSGPDSRWSPIESMYVHAIASARRRLWITNPYFVPSSSIEKALIAAALRGVDTRILIPSRSDSLVVQLASESYLPTLLEAGVRIWQYERGFVHAKTMVVDEWAGTIGSANMDMRSFQLNFELNPFVVEAEFARQLATVFLDDLRHAREVRTEDLRRHSIPRRLMIGLSRLFSPLL
jgi:cardiolipin synthase